MAGAGTSREVEQGEFLLRLSDCLRPLADPVAIQETATRLLGEYLHANRVGYAEDQGDGETIAVTRNYVDGVASLVGTYRYRDYGAGLLEELRAGRRVVRPDIAQDPFLPPEEKQTNARLQLGATVNVPLVKAGRLVAILFLHFREAHAFTSGELLLLDEVAERTWAAVERARVEFALRESEARYRSLFNSIDEGFCVIEMIFDAGGRAVDYRFLEVNPAFASQTGLTNATGHTVRELVPKHESHWFEVYGNVARTGEPARFELPARALEDRWYDVYAFRTGRPDERRVAVLFKDVSSRHRADRKLRANEERQTFLLRLSDALRSLSNPIEIQEAAAAILGRQLGVNRVHYGEMEGSVVVIARDYAEGVSPLKGRLQLDDFGAPIATTLRAGQTLVVPDTGDSPVLGAAASAALRGIQVGAVIAVPLIKEGHLVALIAVHQVQPRVWTAAEIALVEATAERTWAAVERARAEERLGASEERLRAVLAAGHMATWHAELAGDALAASDTLTGLLGLPAGEKIASRRRAFDLVHPEDRERYRVVMQLAAREGGGWHTEFRIVRPRDGRVAWLEEHAHIARDPLTGHLVVDGLVRDITARKEALAALQSSDERLRLALDAANMGTFIWHVEEDRSEPDARMLALFGLPPETRLTLKGALANNIHPDDREASIAAVQRACDPAGTGQLRQDLRVRLPDGHLRWVAITAQVYFEGEPRRAARLAGVAVDITDRKRTEEALRDADQKKNEFLALLGHELRNPLAAIKGGMSLLQSTRTKAESRAAAIPIVVEQVAHMERLIDDVLDLARIERGKLQVRRERIDLLATIERALEMVKELAVSKAAIIRQKIPREPILLDADAVRLTQVVVNLLTNALKFSPNGATIEVGVTRNRTTATIRVRDHGMGISAELLPRIFDTFVQSERSLKIPEGGLGLGLSVARQLVEMHGGTLEAFSEGEGKGSELVLELPLPE